VFAATKAAKVKNPRLPSIGTSVIYHRQCVRRGWWSPKVDLI
jgi:hypothetical protein